MCSIQQSILDGRFPDFIQDFFKEMFPDKAYPDWAVEALRKVNVDLSPDGKDTYRPKDIHETVNKVEESEGETNTDRAEKNINCVNKNSTDSVQKLGHEMLGDSSESLNTHSDIANDTKHNTATAETTHCKSTGNVIK